MLLHISEYSYGEKNDIHLCINHFPFISSIQHPSRIENPSIILQSAAPAFFSKPIANWQMHVYWATSEKHVEFFPDTFIG